MYDSISPKGLIGIKKIICILLVLSAVFSLCACKMLPAPHIPDCYESCVEHFDPNGTQDFTDYCKYIYGADGAEVFDSRSEYSPVTDADVENVIGYFENFSEWMSVEKRSAEFDFDASCINAGDYWYIDTMEGRPIGNSEYGKYDNYSVYYFDVESGTLYYIHTNI